MKRIVYGRTTSQSKRIGASVRVAIEEPYGKSACVNCIGPISTQDARINLRPIRRPIHRALNLVATVWAVKPDLWPDDASRGCHSRGEFISGGCGECVGAHLSQGQRARVAIPVRGGNCADRAIGTLQMKSIVTRARAANARPYSDESVSGEHGVGAGRRQ